MIAALESPAVRDGTSARIEELTRTTSATRLNGWLRCRLQFYFRYVLRLRKSPTPALHVGSVVHAVLQAWNLARWRGEPFQIERFKSWFDSEWIGKQKDNRINWDGEEAAEQTTAWATLEAYFRDTPIPADEKPAAVEVPMEADLSRHGLPTLIGVIDLVRAGGRIVDFKTVAQTPTSEKAIHQNELQLAGYAVLYRDATGTVEGGLELHHLVKLKQPKVIITSLPPITATQETRLFRVMESYVEGLRRRDFVPSPGLQCLGCEFFPECRLWKGET